MSDWGPADLFRRCREALGTQQAVADRLHVAVRTIRSWEAGERPVPGLAWVALGFILNAEGLARLPLEIREELNRETP